MADVIRSVIKEIRFGGVCNCISGVDLDTGRSGRVKALDRMLNSASKDHIAYILKGTWERGGEFQALVHFT